MKLGYARVSRGDSQSTHTQIDLLKNAGCERIYEEQLSGGRWDRPELHRLLDHVRDGDVVVVWKLDRLARSLKDLISIMDLIERRGGRFLSLTESIDTTTPAGRMLMQMIGSVAEFERAMVKERTKAGMAAAARRGVKVGRPPALTPQQKEHIREGLEAGKSEAELAQLFNVSRSTVWRLAQSLRE